MRSYTDEQLTQAVARSHSWRGVLRSIGLAATSSSAMRSVRHHADRLGLDHNHFTGQRRWTEDELAEAVATSRSWSAVATKLGLAGGSSTTVLKGHAVRLGIDYVHLGRRVPTVPSHSAPMAPDPAQLPRAGSLLAAGWFTMCGYEVSWPLEPCRYDLVAGREGALLRVQVKTTRLRQSETWVVSLSTTGGTRLTYDPDDIDYFFVIDGDMKYYLLPIVSVGGLHAISLGAYQQFRLSQLPSAESRSARLGAVR